MKNPSQDDARRSLNTFIAFVVPAGQVSDLFDALHIRATRLLLGHSEPLRKHGVEIEHLLRQLRQQAAAQGWKQS